jgi:tetratricopeptide (TPR) repeat protein
MAFTSIKQSHPRQVAALGVAPTRPSDRHFWVAIAIILAATALVFGRIVGFSFLGIDDPDNILLNPYLNPPTWAHVARFWRQPYLSLYVPVTYTLWSAEAWLAWPTGAPTSLGKPVPFDPRVFHAGSVLLHGGCAVLAFLVLGRLVNHVWAACAGALAFALHPLQVESVGWITENKGLLAALFSLLALWQYLCFAQSAADEKPRYRGRYRGGASRGWFHFAAATLAFLLALLSKPSAAALPLIVAAVDYLLLNRPFPATLRLLSIWAVIALAVLWLTQREQSGSTITFASPLWARPLLAGDALAFYLRKLILPVSLSPDYGRSLPVVLRQYSLWFLWIFPLAVLVVLWWLPARRTSLAAAAIFAAALSPVLGLVPFAYQAISTVADRYAYFALLGPALACAALLAYVWNAWTATAAAALVPLLGALSFAQTSVWRNDDAWVQRALRVNPASLYGHEFRAQSLERQMRPAEARQMRQRSVEQNPQSLEALFYLGSMCIRQGDLSSAESCYRQALNIHPASNIARALLAEILVRQGRYEEGIAELRQAARNASGDRNLVAQATRVGSELMARDKTAEAQEVFSTALRLRPDSIEALNNLAVLASRNRDLNAALRYCDQALSIDPRHAATLVNRGAILMATGRLVEGIENLRRAAASAPHDFHAQSNLALALLRARRAADALAAYRQALALDPGWLQGQHHLAWLLATLPDANQRNGAEAASWAQRLCQATRQQDPAALDVLAAARAEQGDFRSAIDLAQRAAALARQAGRDDQGRAIEARLELYRSSRPYREAPGASFLP